jgi:hypothetical protein
MDGAARSTWLPAALAFVLVAAAGRPSQAAPQGGAFPIADTAIREFAISSAFDGTNFMVGVQGNTTSSSVGAQRVSPSGTLVGQLISTGHSGSVPSIAFGGTDYLLVWSDGALVSNDDIWGAVITTSGNQTWIGPISQHGVKEDTSCVASGPAGFLVVYSRAIAPNSQSGHVYGRIVTSGGVVHPEYQISSAVTLYDDMSFGSVASDGNDFLVVWVDEQNQNEVRGRIIAGNGVPGAPDFLISSTTQLCDFTATVEFGGSNYLVAWQEQAGSGGGSHWDIHARLVSPTGVLVGASFGVSTEAGDQGFPCLGTAGGLFLATWTDLRNDLNGDWVCDPGEGTCADLYAQYIDSAGVLLGDEWPLVQGDGNQFGSPVTPGAGRYLLSWTDGLFPLFEWEGDVFGQLLPQSGFPDDYCVAKPNSQGCEPEIWVAGIPSATDPAPCVIGCDLVLNNKFGLMIYGFNPNNAPFQGGTLCVKAPHKRTPVQLSGGNPPPSDCSGTYALDFNARIQSGVDLMLIPGQTIYAQYWYRDPLGSTYPSGLSDAVTFVIQP